MPTPQEPDFPAGHPARGDYNPASAEAQEWARRNIHPEGERDFPVDHPKAVDTPGNTNHYTWAPGLDPAKPHLEAHTGRTPEQAKAAADVYKRLGAKAKPTPALEPVMAPARIPDPGKQRAIKAQDEDAYLIECPACGCGHKFDSRWTFNGSLELPTFTPSMMVNASDEKLRCHSYVTNGQIQYLADCGHSMRGKTVELPAIGTQQETIHA